MQKKIIFTDRTNELLRQYFKDISKYKIYSPEELGQLIVQAQSGNKDAKDKIITSNLKFVITIAKQFQNRGVPLMDLISEGTYGLILSIDKFDISKNVPFLSYASWWIKREIHNAIYWSGKSIRLPVSQQLIVLQIIKASQELSKKLNRTPNNTEIAQEIDVPVEKIDRLSKFANSLVSVDDFIKGDEESNQVCDVLVNPDEVLPDEAVNDKFILEALEHILPKLSIREHDVIVMAYGIGIPKVNKKTICEMFNVTYERIRQIKEHALKKLRTVHRTKLEKLL